MPGTETIHDKQPSSSSPELLAAVFNAPGVANKLLGTLSGTLFEDPRTDPEIIARLPFRALLLTSLEHLETLLKKADIGVYGIEQRIIKPRQQTSQSTSQANTLDGVIGLFTMIANPALGHEKSDAHWRNIHAPLALRSHTAMSHYRQLSIAHRYSGPEWDGFALCGFDSLLDLKENFFASEQAKQAIGKDTAIFADTRRSPGRLIVKESLSPSE